MVNAPVNAVTAHINGRENAVSGNASKECLYRPASNFFNVN